MFPADARNPRGAVGPERDSGVAQVAQVAHALTIGWPAKLGLLQDRFFELGVGDLAVRHRLRDVECAEESDSEENSREFHYSSDLWCSAVADLNDLKPCVP